MVTFLPQDGFFRNHIELNSFKWRNHNICFIIFRDCQINKAAYPTFQLNSVFNVDTLSESRQWDIFRDKVDKINIKLDHVKLLSPELYAQLDELLQGLSVNLTAHRMQVTIVMIFFIHLH